MATGIVRKHRAACPPGKRKCECPYQASVWSAREGKRIRKHFPTLAAAKAWRSDAQGALRRRTMRAPRPTTVAEAAQAWLEGVEAGTIRNRRGELYKPSARRSYERALRLRVLPEIGRLKLSNVARNDVQDFADRLLAEGLDPSTIRNTLNPLQAIFRRAMARGDVAVNPTAGLDLAASAGRRDRIAAPGEAASLIAALRTEDRALWATALYAGLRRGELRALRWRDLDLATGLIRVERAWDDEEGEIEGKTRAARRTVPIAVVLRDHLVEHRMRREGDGEALVFGTSPTDPLQPSNVRRRALADWKRAGLDPIGLHECRHTFASLMIAAGVNAKALSTYMGHASVTITFDRYGHLMPGNESEAAGLLDAFLARTFEAEMKPIPMTSSG